MGVIDLDARVKKLEQEAGGGAVIDQLEAAVTALEETVNGDGDTDLGLVGDVAALNEQINGDGETDLGRAGDVAELQQSIPGPAVKTAVTTGITHGAADSGTGGIYYTVSGSVVHLHVGAGSLTADDAFQTLFTLPAAVRPSSILRTMSYATPGAQNYAYCQVQATGEVQYLLAYGSATNAVFDLCWVLVPTT